MFLSAADSANYLGISEGRLWIHVREGRLRPVAVASDGLGFSLEDLAALDSYYRESARMRRTAGVWYAIVFVLASVGAGLLWNVSERVSFFVLNVAAVCSGVSFRALWLARKDMNLPRPTIEYVLAYPVLTLVSAAAIQAGLGIARVPVQNLALSGLALGFAFGLYIHPDFWPLPKWSGLK